MYLLSVGLLIIFAQSAFTEEQLLHPCNTQDIGCLSKTTENFLEQTSGGIPQYDFRPIDPLWIPSIQLSLMNFRKVQLLNVTVTGLKKLKIKDFKMNTEEKSVLLAMEANVKVVGDIVSSTARGKFSGNMIHLVTASYPYDLKPNEKGVQYFTVGKETLVCDNKDAPELLFCGDVDADFKSKLENSEELKKKILCGVAEIAFVDIIHNLRASAKIFPKSAYFTNI